MTRVLIYFFSGLLALPGCLLWPPAGEATVNEVAASNRYTANGTTTVFAYGFKILTKNDIEVTSGTTVLTVDSHYTVSGLGASGGGNVTMITAPLNGTIVTLLRKQPVKQVSTYVPNEPFPSTRLEKDLDKVVMQVQELTEKMNRALKLVKSSALAGPDVDAPVVGSFMRGKVGGGVDWATVVTTGASITLPLVVADGGTGAANAASAAVNLAVLPLAGGTLTGNLLTNSAISSTQACATGYTRIGPNLCKAIVPITTAYVAATSCTGHVVDANLPTNKVAWIKINWVSLANNGAGARTGTTQIYGGINTCSVALGATTFTTYEQTAIAAGTVLAGGSDFILTTTLSGTLYTIDGNTGGNGTSVIASFTSWGYFD